MASRRQRAEVAEETLRVLARGSYELEGAEVSIAPALARAVAGTVFYPADATLSVPAAVAPEGEGAAWSATQIEVTTENTVQAGKRLHDELHGDSSGLCVLNFASAKNPGGGFQGGAQAQEESLARSSGLYPCLTTQLDHFYKLHRSNPQDGLYSHCMLYSPQVPFFRADAGDFTSLWCASVITSPAPNAGVAQQRRSRADLLEALRERCGRILRLARAHGLTDLVLGAFGCGVFRNDPKDVAAAFDFWLRQSPEFERAFRRVVFAIPGAGAANHETFRACFGGVLAAPTFAGRAADVPAEGAAEGAPGTRRGAGGHSGRLGGKGGGSGSSGSGAKQQQPRARKSGRWSKVMAAAGAEAE